MINAFKQHIEQNFAFLKGKTLLIAVSGGIDSIVLSHLCHNMQLHFAVAHCNFKLRGDESDSDEIFVKNYAKKLQVPCFTIAFNTTAYAQEHKRSIQMAARELRYHWFEELLEQHNYDYILTAHHADDNLETFLINFTRGTGIDGLTGIPKINLKCVRPLLPFSRNEISQFALNQCIAWAEDSGNSAVKYVRNKLRHEVVPILKTINPSVLQSFKTTLEHLTDSKSIINDAMQSFLQHAIVTTTQYETKYLITAFTEKKSPKSYLFETFKDFGFTQWEDIENLLTAQSGKYVASSTHRLVKSRNFLILSKIEEQYSKVITIENMISPITTPLGTLVFNTVDTFENNTSQTIYIAQNKIHNPLVLRKREEGDVIYPIGMQGQKKKLSKFFKDEKFSLIDKENAWLLCSNNHIVWVVGCRADERFKATEFDEILKISII